MIMVEIHKQRALAVRYSRDLGSVVLIHAFSQSWRSIFKARNGQAVLTARRHQVGVVPLRSILSTSKMLFLIIIK